MDNLEGQNAQIPTDPYSQRLREISTEMSHQEPNEPTQRDQTPVMAKTDRRVFDIDEVIGNPEDDIVIRYRPEGVPGIEEVEYDDLPGVRFRGMDDETLEEFKDLYSGKGNKKGNPKRAQIYLLRKQFKCTENIATHYRELGFNSELDWLIEHPKGRVLQFHTFPKYINKTVPTEEDPKG